MDALMNYYPLLHENNKWMESEKSKERVITSISYCPSLQEVKKDLRLQTNNDSSKLYQQHTTSRVLKMQAYSESPKLYQETHERNAIR